MTVAYPIQPPPTWTGNFIVFGHKNKSYQVGAGIGRGSFAQAATLIRVLPSPDRLTGRAIKYVDPKEPTDLIVANIQIQNEFSTLQQMGPRPGIIKPPKYLIRKVTSTGLLIYATIGPKYDGTLKSLANTLTREEVIDALGQVLCGLSHLHPRRNHGDLKADNIFWRTVKGKREFEIADMGDARTEEEYKSRPDAGAMTPAILCHGDMDTLQTYFDLTHHLKLPGKDQGFWEFQLARDIAAIGLTFYDILCPNQILYKPVLSISSIKFPDLESFYNQIDTSDPILALLKKMLNPDYRLRPTAIKAYNDWVTLYFTSKAPPSVLSGECIEFPKVGTYFILPPNQRYRQGASWGKNSYSETFCLIPDQGEDTSQVVCRAHPLTKMTQVTKMTQEEANAKLQKEFKILDKLYPQKLGNIRPPSCLITIPSSNALAMICDRAQGSLTSLLQKSELLPHQKILLLGHLLYWLNILHKTHAHRNLSADAIHYKISTNGKWTFFISQLGDAKTREEAKSDQEWQQWLVEDICAVGNLVPIKGIRSPWIALFNAMTDKDRSKRPTAENAYRQFISYQRDKR